MFTRSDLKTHQEKAIQFIKEKKRCGLFLDMGLGKTALTLTAITDLLKENQVNKILIIAPLKVANSVWQQEIDKWEHLRYLTSAVCTGSPTKRLDAVNKNVDIHIINAENLLWLVKNSKWKWDMVIIDESSMFKSSSTVRFKVLKKTLKYLKSIVLLTGTPSPNGIIDLWSQIYLLDHGERLGATIWHFRNKYFVQPNSNINFYIPKSGSFEMVSNKINDICLSMNAKDYLHLPDKNLIVNKIKLTDDILNKYQKLENDLKLELGETKIVAFNVMSKVNKLLQICNGFVYDAEGNAHEIHTLKIQALKKILNNNSANVLIAYYFKEDLNALKKEFPEAVVLDNDFSKITAWNDGQIKMLLAHPKSAGHGLNLQYGGSTIIWYSLSWSLENYQQFNSRLHRQGQNSAVKIIHLVTEDTYELKVLKALNSKATNQQELIDYLKKTI